MCKQCEKKPIYEFTNKRKVCKNCFIRWFEKKFLYTIRKFKMIRTGEKIGYIKDNSLNQSVLEELMKMYSKRGIIKLIDLDKNRKVDKILKPLNSNDISLQILSGVLNEKLNLNYSLPVDRKIINPLILFLDKEIEIYAKLKKIKYKKIKKNKITIQDFLWKLEIKHPELPHAVVQSVLKLS